MKSFKSFLNEAQNPVVGAADEGSANQARLFGPSKQRATDPGFSQTPAPEPSYHTNLPGIHVLNHHLKAAQEGSFDTFSTGLGHALTAATELDKKSLPAGQTTATHGYVTNPNHIEYSDDEGSNEEHNELVGNYVEMFRNPQTTVKVPSLKVMVVPGSGNKPHRVVAYDSHDNAVLEALRKVKQGGAGHFTTTHPMVISGQHKSAYDALRQAPRLEKQRRAMPLPSDEPLYK